MPQREQELYALLIFDLKESGPVQTGWPNFSSLGKNKYHCHLKYSWVACWKWDKGSFIVEVYYAGSRENAPYKN